MAVIPRQVYDEVEARLYERKTLVVRASERLARAQEMAYSIPSFTPEALPEKAMKKRGVNPNTIHGKGVTGDPTERATFAILQAEADFCTATKWAEVFSRLDEIFAGKPEAVIADAIYTQHELQKDVAARLHYDRQSVRRYRDTYVCHCALIAAEQGLIKITEDENNV